MKIVAIINQKGGVGKTTTSIKLVAGLVMEDERVLVFVLHRYQLKQSYTIRKTNP
jgi:MinD-like ATPase involved in chromosome partitioning or flagellar assembly